MRHHQAHEADHARHGHRGRRQEGGHGREAHAAEADLHAQALGHFIAQLQRVGALDAGEGQHQTHARVGGQDLHLLPGAAGKAAVHEGEHAFQAIGIEHLQQRVVRAQHRIDGHAGEDDAHGIHAALPGQRIDERAGERRAREGENGHRVGEVGEDEQNGGRRRARASGYADGAGVGQGVAHHGLQQRARGGERGADQQRQQQARQAQVIEDDLDGVLLAAKQGAQDLRNGVSRAAHRKSDQGQDRHRHDQKQPDAAHL